MSFRDSDRFEYIRQPHIIALIVIAILAASLAVYTAVSRLQDRSRRSDLATDQACLELVQDEALCRFAAASETANQKSSQSVVSTTDDSGTTITVVDIENADRLQSVTRDKHGRETEVYLIYDADSFVKDTTSGAWKHFHDETFEATTPDEVVTAYDFTSETSQDVIEFRDYYTRVAEEPCDGRTCLKYQLTLPDDPSTIYLWFDTEEYLLRRYQAIAEDTTTNTQLNYDPVTITPPEAYETVSEEDFNALLE